jgi:hypothetical protein
MGSVRVIWLMLVMTVLEPLKFSRLMQSFRVRRVTVIIEFDAFLSGIGIIWNVVDEEGNERPVMAASVDISMLRFGEDSQYYQNSAEFIAATIVGLIGLILLGLDECAVKLRGNSRSALCWGDHCLLARHAALEEKEDGTLIECDLAVQQLPAEVQGLLGTEAHTALPHDQKCEWGNGAGF